MTEWIRIREAENMQIRIPNTGFQQRLASYLSQQGPCRMDPNPRGQKHADPDPQHCFSTTIGIVPEPARTLSPPFCALAMACFSRASLSRLLTATVSSILRRITCCCRSCSCSILASCTCTHNRESIIGRWISGLFDKVSVSSISVIWVRKRAYYLCCGSEFSSFRIPDQKDSKSKIRIKNILTQTIVFKLSEI